MVTVIIRNPLVGLVIATLYVSVASLGFGCWLKHSSVQSVWCWNLPVRILLVSVSWRHSYHETFGGWNKHRDLNAWKFNIIQVYIVVWVANPVAILLHRHPACFRRQHTWHSAVLLRGSEFLPCADQLSYEHLSDMFFGCSKVKCNTFTSKFTIFTLSRIMIVSWWSSSTFRYANNLKSSISLVVSFLICEYTMIAHYCKYCVTFTVQMYVHTLRGHSDIFHAIHFSFYAHRVWISKSTFSKLFVFLMTFTLKSVVET